MDQHFVNPIAEGSQVVVVRDGDRYLWCRADGDQSVAVWVSDRVSTLGRRHVVWTAPASGPATRGVRPSDLVARDGRWYLYLSAHDGDDRNRLVFVLVSERDDPLGPYQLSGPLATGEHEPGWPSELWAADLVLLYHGGRSYAVWSGWPGRRSEVQQLYVDELTGPTELSGHRVAICPSDQFDWERPDPRAPGINEAPKLLARDGRLFLVYSCSAAWLPSYRMGMLELVGDDPLEASSWRKGPEPVFSSGESTLGVGHGTFVRDGDDRWWMVFDAKWDAEPGWRRSIFVQPVDWDGDGSPVLGQPMAAGQEVEEPKPAGWTPVDDARHWDFANAKALDDFDYYGHHQFMACSEDGLDLGIEPQSPVNGYRSGEKVVLRDGVYADLRVSSTFRVVSGERDAGVLFRVTDPAVGFDAQHGYYAALFPIRRSVVMGKMDGGGWTEIGFSQIVVDAAEAVTLTVEARGDRLSVAIGEPAEVVLVVRDADFATGSVGCRVVDTHARFASLDVAPLR